MSSVGDDKRNGVFGWEIYRFLFNIEGENEVKFREPVDLWVGIRTRSLDTFLPFLTAKTVKMVKEALLMFLFFRNSAKSPIDQDERLAISPNR